MQLLLGDALDIPLNLASNSLTITNQRIQYLAKLLPFRLRYLLLLLRLKPSSLRM